MGVEVCPVHKSEIKSFQNSSIHVGAMLCDPQPKGLKRRYPEGDDDDPPPNRNRAQTLYSQQRQEIFEISYEKLCRFRQAPDTSLLRYVLIFNTMRNVEQEMERDGIKIGCLSGGPFLPPVNCQVSTLDPPPSSHAMGEGQSPVGFPPSPYSFDAESKPTLPTVISSPTVMNENTCGNANSATNYSTDYDRCVMDLDCSPSGRMTPFVRTAYDRVESGALWTDESDRLTSLNWSSVLNFNSGSSGSASSCSSVESVRTTPANSQFDASSNSSSSSSDNSVSDDAMCGTETSLHTLMPPTTGVSTCMSSLSITYSSSPSNSPNTSPSSGNVSPGSGSSPTSSEDEIFGDVDLTLYDFDLLSPLSPPNVKMAPVSAEELMRSLSNNPDSASSCSASSYYKMNISMITETT